MAGNYTKNKNSIINQSVVILTLSKKTTQKTKFGSVLTYQTFSTLI